jgi:hypothetical protein
MQRFVLVLFLLVNVVSARAQSGIPSSDPVIPAYTPITGQQRLEWTAHASFGPSSLLGGAVSAGIDTLRNSPSEYGPHWAGFGKRYGLRLSNRVISSGIEASAGSLWGEDPRYFRAPEKRPKARFANIVRMTVISHNRAGREMPAYARFLAVPSSAFLSNAWEPDSHNSTGDALNRIAASFATRIIGNAFSEFWPDVRRRLLHRRQSSFPAVNDPSAIR